MVGTCVFCRRPITGERGAGMNVRSARRLFGSTPPAALAVTDDAGNERWFGHRGCIGEAGDRVRPPSRAQRREALLSRPFPDSRAGLATLLAKLELLDQAGYAALTEAQRNRFHDLSYVDELIAGGVEVEPALRTRVRIRQLGHHLNELGGKPLMREVLHLAAAPHPQVLRAVEMCWDKIGDWRG